VPPRLQSDQIDVDREFESPLCLASTLLTAQRFRPDEVREMRGPEGSHRISNHHVLVRQTDKAPKVARQRWEGLEIAY
jgi:hypothetical protein